MNTTQVDLLGDPPMKPVKGGYAGRPGEGPDGETCGTCEHSFRQGRSRSYWKCGLGRVSNCEATDIRKGAPACQYWEPVVGDQDS